MKIFQKSQFDNVSNRRIIFDILGKMPNYGEQGSVIFKLSDDRGNEIKFEMEINELRAVVDFLKKFISKHDEELLSNAMVNAETNIEKASSSVEIPNISSFFDEKEREEEPQIYFY